ncbi:MAG: C39 family peptidase [Lachnospiraceae bacterium]
MKKYKIGLVIAAFACLFAAAGCSRALETASEKFDSLVGNLLPAGSDSYGEDGAVTVRVLTPTPTPEPTLSPTPTLPPTPTPTPANMPPAGEKVDEWVYATSAVNIRAGWSTDYLIVGGLAANDAVHRVEILENGWSKVSYNSAYGYVNSSYLTTEIPTKVATVHMDTMQYTYEAIMNGEDVVMLGVQNILQKPDLPAGPEITSLAIVLRYLGFSVDKVTLAENYLTTAEPGTASPFVAYLGDPAVATGSYGCYAPVIVEAANRYFEATARSNRAIDVSGSTLEDLYEYVRNGTPVIVWATTNLVATKYTTVWEIDGETIQWRGYEHCMVLMGYNNTKGTVILADPLRGIVEYDAEKFYSRYKEQYESAVIISGK